MNDEALIHSILIDRDIAAFVSADWDSAATDFDGDSFVGCSGESGTVRLAFPTLDAYRDSWLAQARDMRDVDRLDEQLHAAQRLDLIDVSGDRAVATKIFDGVIAGPGGEVPLAWTTYYFLRRDAGLARWLITGFLGYLPHPAHMSERSSS